MKKSNFGGKGGGEISSARVAAVLPKGLSAREGTEGSNAKKNILGRKGTATPIKDNKGGEARGGRVFEEPGWGLRLEMHYQPNKNEGESSPCLTRPQNKQENIKTRKKKSHTGGAR